ncbi:MAG: hypothetical protein KC502_15570 [Myxococcales bacterium]|nr:hypothetical protein [Myxococcales bacterium]
MKAIVVATLILAGCSTSAMHRTIRPNRRGPSIVVVQNPPPAARLAFGTLSLLMHRTTVKAITAQWPGAAELPMNDSVTLTPPPYDPAKQYQVRFEKGRVIQFAVTYRRPDPLRVSMRHAYPVSKVQYDGSWAMTDKQRHTLVLLSEGGRSLVATHLHQTLDTVGARAMRERYLGD